MKWEIYTKLQHNKFLWIFPYDSHETYIKNLEPITLHDVTVPVEFEGNGASIPAFAWWIVGSPFDGQALIHFHKHDFCYQTGCVPRRLADVQLLEGLIETDYRSWRAYLIYFNVRMFGWMFYKKRKHIGKIK